MNKVIKIFVLDLLILIFMVGCNENKEKMQEDFNDKVKTKLVCIANENYDDYYIVEDTYTLNFDEQTGKLLEYTEEEIFNYGKK